MNAKVAIFGPLFVLTAALPLEGQDQRPGAAYAADRCREALDALGSAGASTSGLHRRQALSWVARCGQEGATALAAELRRLTTVSDSTELMSSYYRIAGVLDSTVLRAAMDLAADRRATAGSRIIALKLLISYADVGRVSLPFSSFLPGNPPTISSQDHFGRVAGAPLPDGWQEGALDLVNRLAEDPAESDTIRHAAGFARIFLHKR